MTRTPVPVVRLHPWRIAAVLAVITAVLVALHLFFSINELYIGWDFPGSTFFYVLFDLHGEVTVPTWYSSSLLLLCAFALAGVAALKLQWRDRFRYHWAGLAVMFLGISVEESADVHGAVSHKMTNMMEVGGVLTYPWVLPAVILVVIVGVIYIPFLRELPRHFRNLFILAGGVYVFGALGMEVIEAAYDSAVSGEDFVYLMMVTVEETLEMAGAIIFLGGVLTYLGTIAPSVQVDVVE